MRLPPTHTGSAMTIVAIVYYSGYGHTAKLAEAIHAGAASAEGTTATLYRIDAEGNLPQGTWEEISRADAVIYGSPCRSGCRHLRQPDLHGRPGVAVQEVRRRIVQ